MVRKKHPHRHVLPLTLLLGLLPREAEGDLLSFHRPTYFTTGLSPDTQVKFQFSIKYDLWPNQSGHGAYFAYTQKSLWNVLDRSAPFTESNYAPEVFYAHTYERWKHPGATGCGLLSHRIGAEHESNGEGADRSRAWNRVYANSQALCASSERGFVSWGLSLWFPFGLMDNPDIAKYLGYGDINVRAGTADSDNWYGRGEIGVAVRKGAARRGSMLLEARWMPGYGSGSRRDRVWRFTPYVYSQLFAGYGETLLSYDQSRLRFRIGFGFDDRSFLPDPI